MKKILAILLSVLMMASVMALPAFAEATGTTTGAALNDLAAYGQGIYTVAESTPTVNGKIAEDEYTTSFKYHQVDNETYPDLGEYTLYVAQDANNIYFAAQYDEKAGRECTVLGNDGNMNLGSRFRIYINFPSEFTAKDANNYLVLNFNHVGNVTGAKAYGDAEFVAEMGTSALAPYFAATPDLMQSGTAGSLNAETSFNAIGLVTAYSFGGKGTDVATYEIALSRVKLMEIFGWNGKTDMTYMASLGSGVQGGTNFRPWSTQMADPGNYYRPEAAAALEAYSAANGDNTAVAPMVGQGANGQAMANHADVIPDIIKFAAHVHDSEGEWVTDDDMHWKECACGETAYEDEHAFDEGAVTREPTKYTEGEKTYTCTVCGYAKVEKTGKLEDKPAATTPSATDAPAATTDGGCFGAVSLAVLAVVPALAVAFVAKKKED